MKKQGSTLLVFLCIMHQAVLAEASLSESTTSELSTTSSHYHTGHPDSHAPIGVMWDHTHEAGELMVSYRFMQMRMEGYLNGTNELSSQDIFARGFMVAPTSMEMQMHMMGLMYAPSNQLTLSVMLNYQEKTMNNFTRPGSMARMMRGERFTDTQSGWGDFSIAGLYKIYDSNNQRIHFSLGLSIPTGKFNTAAYPMQYTTGTWDILPGVTWLWQHDRLSGGFQLSGRIHLEENSEGFTYGDVLKGTAWASLKITDEISVSGRFTLKNVWEIEGEDRDLIGIRMAPPMDPNNSGGTFAELGLGSNFLITQGILKGNRLAVEFIVPFYQDVNGLQMEMEWSLVAGWQLAW